MPKRTSSLGARHGFALIELTAALFILTVGLFGVITMYHFGLDKTRVLNESVSAVRAIQNELETLRAVPFDALRPVVDGPFVSHTPEAERLVNATPRLTITDCPDAHGRLKQISVSLAWTGEHGRRIEKSLTTLIADKGQSTTRYGHE